MHKHVLELTHGVSVVISHDPFEPNFEPVYRHDLKNTAKYVLMIHNKGSLAWPERIYKADWPRHGQ